VKRARILLLLAAAGCAGEPPEPQPPQPPASSAEAAAEARRPGAYYKDDGPGDNVPDNLAAIPEPEPRVESLNRFANRPYEVFGKRYVPLAALQPFRQRGIASWYGKRFHGQKTSSGERYDMYAMSAAHPTLPIPSYARVTRIATGQSVVVRINDRGPFHAGRIIDLSYAAAYRLGIVQVGSGEVQLEAIVPGAPTPPTGATVDAPPPGVFLQVGAFASRENAESLRARLAASEDAAEVLLMGSLWRLQLGPYRSQDEARAAAERLERAFDLKPLVVVR
jgi:rare lipoprotein A